MNGIDFKETRKALGLKTQRHVAIRFGVKEVTVQKWEQGKNPIPTWAIKMLILIRRNKKRV